MLTLKLETYRENSKTVYSWEKHHSGWTASFEQVSAIFLDYDEHMSAYLNAAMSSRVSVVSMPRI